MCSPPSTPSAAKVERDMIEGKKIVAQSTGNALTGLPSAPPAALPCWIWPHLLSLDAPAVAVGWQAWWAHLAGVPLGWSHHAILGLSVWMIYLADRLADTRRASPAEWGTQRHEFYHRRRMLPLFLLTASVASLVFLAPRWLSGPEFVGGAVLLGVVAAYFWQTHARPGWPLRAPKEAVVGGLFAVGTAYFVAVRAGPSWMLGMRVVLFGALCFLNCALITRWERTLRDRRDRHSLLNAFPALTERLGLFAIGTAAAAALAGAMTGQFRTFAPLMLSAAGLFALDAARNRIPALALRVLADAALLTPWMFLRLI